MPSQTSLVVVTLVARADPEVLVSFPAVNFKGEAEIGLSGLPLKREPGVSDPTALLFHNKLMPAMVERLNALLVHCGGTLATYRMSFSGVPAWAFA